MLVLIEMLKTGYSENRFQHSLGVQGQSCFIIPRQAAEFDKKLLVLTGFVDDYVG